MGPSKKIEYTNMVGSDAEHRRREIDQVSVKTFSE